jgi:putative transposase
MALDQSALLDVLDALKVADVGDRVREAAETIYQALIEAELTDAIGAAPHERSAERSNLRNGHRVRTLTTTAGDLELRIPKLRTGSFFPSLLERRRRVRPGPQTETSHAGRPDPGSAGNCASAHR